MLTCAKRKDAPLTHGHVVTIIAKSLNINLDDFTRVVDCSYFTKQAFVRGKVVDATFQLILVRSRSCWRGLACPPPVVKEQVEDEQEEEDSQGGEPHDTVPFLPYSMPSGSSSRESHILA